MVIKRWLCKKCGTEIRRKVPVFKFYPVAADGEDDETRLDEIYEDDGESSEYFVCPKCDEDTRNDGVELEDIAEYRKVNNERK